MSDLVETPPADWDDGDVPESTDDDDMPETDWGDAEPPAEDPNEEEGR